MNFYSFLSRYQAECLICMIIILSAFLNLWNIWNQGFSNTFYGAAVKSMLVNPGIGFFGSFDPAGFITVDKPPVGIWIQAAFAAVLGFSGWVLVLPQALAGIGSVVLIYFIISRPFGKPAGLVAALALAVTPIFVAISRNGTMDTQLIFVLLLAIWVVLKAAREKSLPWFLVSVTLIGIGFNIKMIQAFIVVPAVFAVYFWGTTDFTWKKRFLHGGLAVVILLAVSLSWAVAVDMVPTDQRPYIGGSGDNTVLGLIIDYNGLNRLGISSISGGLGTGGPGISMNGQPGMWQNSSVITATGPAGSSFPGPGDGQSTSDTTIGVPPGAPDGFQNGMAPAGQGAQQAPSGMQQLGSSGFTGGAPSGASMGGGMNSGGNPSIFRIFREGLAGDISWFLVFAFIGVIAWIRRPRTISLGGFDEAGYMSEKALTLIAMLLWLIPGLLYFSFTTGFWHDYYIATIAPPLAGLVGIGAAGLYQKYITGNQTRWLLIIAILLTGLIQTLFLSYNADWAGPLVPLVLLGTFVFTGLLALVQIHKNEFLAYHRLHIVAIAIGILFIAPLVWSCTPIINGNGGTIPTAGPQSRGQQGAGGLTLIDDAWSTSKLVEYLLAHNTNETWILAVPNSQAAADLIIETGKPVMSLGGFMGSDQVLNVTALQSYIREGKVRYFETGGAGGGGMGGGNSEIFSWVSTHCTAVPASAWDGSTGNQTGTNIPSGQNLPGVAGMQENGMSPSGYSRNLTMTGAGLLFEQGNPFNKGNAGSLPGMTVSPGEENNTLYDCAGTA
jgi:4-amino-4-deoxy-L-arabinose transferase-like glycosyltransferase